MSRLSIDLTDEQEAWDELKALLTERISAAQAGAVSDKSFKQITDEAIHKWKIVN